MPSPLFFSKSEYTPKSWLMTTHHVRPSEQCHFNQIELVCPMCAIKQVYLDATLNGDKTIVCDYCLFDTPVNIGKGGKSFRRMQSDSKFRKSSLATQITVVSRR